MLQDLSCQVKTEYVMNQHMDTAKTKCNECENMPMSLYIQYFAYLDG